MWHVWAVSAGSQIVLLYQAGYLSLHRTTQPAGHIVLGDFQACHSMQVVTADIDDGDVAR
jgi:hypothetical protein